MQDCTSEYAFKPLLTIITVLRIKNHMERNSSGTLMNAAILTSFSPLITGCEISYIANQSCFGCQSMHLMSSCVPKKMKNTGVTVTRQGKVFALSTSQRSSDAAIVDEESMKGEKLASSDFAFTDSKIDLSKTTRNFSTDFHICRTIVTQINDKGRMRSSLHLGNILHVATVAIGGTNQTTSVFKFSNFNFRTYFHTVGNTLKKLLSKFFANVSLNEAVNGEKQKCCGHVSARTNVSNAGIRQIRQLSKTIGTEPPYVIKRKLSLLNIRFGNNSTLQPFGKRATIFRRVIARGSNPGIRDFKTSHAERPF